MAQLQPSVAVWLRPFLAGMAQLQPSVAVWLRPFLAGMAQLQPSVAVWLRPFLPFVTTVANHCHRRRGLRHDRCRLPPLSSQTHRSHGVGNSTRVGFLRVYFETEAVTERRRGDFPLPPPPLPPLPAPLSVSVLGSDNTSSGSHLLPYAR